MTATIPSYAPVNNSVDVTPPSPQNAWVNLTDLDPTIQNQCQTKENAITLEQINKATCSTVSSISAIFGVVFSIPTP